MKKIIISVIILAFGLNLSFADSDKGESSKASTSTIIGTVIDNATGESLVGVTVKVEGTDLKAYTDFEGNFKISGLIPGTYKLTASYISYKDKIIDKVSLTSGDEKEVKVDLKSLNR
jgi:hypothetical protein